MRHALIVLGVTVIALGTLFVAYKIAMALIELINVLNK